MEKPKPRPIPTGILQMPRFSREAPKRYSYRPPPKPSPWEKHFELLRQHPGRRDNDVGWAVVSEVKGKGRAESKQIIKRDRDRIRTHLERKFPLERWQLQIVTVAGSWSDKELYLRYLGEVTMEQHMLDLKLRKERYDQWQAKIAENKAKKEVAARAGAIRERDRVRASRGRRR